MEKVACKFHLVKATQFEKAVVYGSNIVIS